MPGPKFPGVEGERFRRSENGYDPAEVDALIAAREARLERLEQEAQQMAQRVIDTEERLQALLHEREAAERELGPIAKLEEVYGQARRQATRIRMKALDDAVQIADRVTELSNLRDELGSRVSEVAGKAGIKIGAEERAPVGMEPTTERAVPAALDGVYAGPVRIDFGPVADFAQLTAFEDAVGEIPGVRNISVERFSGGRATLAMSLEAPTELLTELKQHAPFEFRLREAHGDGLLLDVTADEREEPEEVDAAEPGEEPGFAQRPAAEHGADQETGTYSVERPKTVLDERDAA